MKISKNFIIQEFVYPEIYNVYNDQCIRFLDSRLIDLVQFFRDRYEKPIIINNWHRSGTLKYSGLRPFTCKYGAALSAHKFGRAADIKIMGIDYDELRDDILKNEKLFMQNNLTAIELDTPTWLHVSCENFLSPKIVQIDFK